MTKFEAVILFNPDLSTLIIEKEEKILSTILNLPKEALFQLKTGDSGI